MSFLSNMAGSLPDFVSIKNLQNACTLPDFYLYWRDNPSAYPSSLLTVQEQGPERDS